MGKKKKKHSGRRRLPQACIHCGESIVWFIRVLDCLLVTLAYIHSHTLRRKNVIFFSFLNLYIYINLIPERPLKLLSFVLALCNVESHQELFEIQGTISIRIKYPARIMYKIMLEMLDLPFFFVTEPI